MSFVHLRIHSEYSFLRGACRLEPLVARAAELGMPALALTDYGVLHGAVRFTEIARRYGVQPILGVEFSLRPGSLPLVLLARTCTGWINLLRLVNYQQLAAPCAVEIDAAAISRWSDGLSAVLHGRREGVAPGSLPAGGVPIAAVASSCFWG